MTPAFSFIAVLIADCPQMFKKTDHEDQWNQPVNGNFGETSKAAPPIETAEPRQHFQEKNEEPYEDRDERSILLASCVIR